MRYENKGSNFRGRKRHAASGPRPREVSRFPTSFPPPPPPPPFARSCNSLFARTKRRKMADFGSAPPKLAPTQSEFVPNSFPTFATVCSTAITTELIYVFFSPGGWLFFFLSFFFFEIHSIIFTLIRLKKNCSGDWDVFFEFLRFSTKITSNYNFKLECFTSDGKFKRKKDKNSVSFTQFSNISLFV